MATLLAIFWATSSWAGDADPTPISNKEAIDLVQTHANYLWTLVAAAMVFFMQAGFAMVEAGFTRAKNAVNFFFEKPDGFLHGLLGFLGHRIRTDVRC